MGSDIGQLLRDTRHRRDLTLTDAARATGVRETHLAALERDELDSYVTEPAYVRGILRTYADYLGLDSADLLERHRLQSVRTAGSPAAGGQRAGTTGGRSRRVASVAAAVIVLAVVGGAIVAVATLRNTDSDDVARAGATTTADAPAAPASEPAQAPDEPSEAASQEVVAPQPPAVEGLAMTLESTGEVWVRVVTDGDTVAEEIMPPGEVREFTADRRIDVRLGVADAVEFSLNGARYGVIDSGTPGPVDIVCTKKDGCTPQDG